MLTEFCGNLIVLFCFTFLFNSSSFLENVQSNVTYCIEPCFGIEESIDITGGKYPGPDT